VLDTADQLRLKNNCDWYCYLCHTSENVTKCARCERAVHKLCANSDDEDTPETSSDPIVTNFADIANTETEINSDAITSRRTSSILNGDICVDDSWLPYVVLKKEPLKTEESELDESKPIITDDCQFVTVVRQPAKRRTCQIKNDKLVPDETAVPDDNQIQELAGVNVSYSDEIICQRCKLLNASDKSQLPNVSVSELNSLLGFLYNRIKPWYITFIQIIFERYTRNI
jgi:hypothetical protein